MNNAVHSLTQSPLGKKRDYTFTYDPSILFAIPRKHSRDLLNIQNSLPFQGEDIWTAYELSWLNPKGKPEVACAEIHFPCRSPYLIESKSLKFYLNSYNQSHFQNRLDVRQHLEKDLSEKAGANVSVHFIDPIEFKTNIPSIDIDHLDIVTNCYHVDPSLLNTTNENVQQRLKTDLFRSLCPVTGQPDWATVYLHYTGPKIIPESLLSYFVSYREHQAFHENCVENIFTDIMHQCHPTNLTVYARFLRRGGLDINPFRSNFESAPKLLKQSRQ